MLDFAQRHVVVTGGTGALGVALVAELLARGATCHVTCLDAQELQRFPQRDHERVHVTLGVDLAEETAVEALFAGLPALWASIHAAGGFSMAPIADTSLRDYQGMMQMNATTAFLCSREAVKAIRRSTGEGRIVNVSARPALVPAGGAVAYAASKGAVASLSACLAEELAQEGIFVNAVAPGVLDTPANRRAMPQADPGAWAAVDAVARAVAFLASPANGVVRGANVPVYGRG